MGSDAACQTEEEIRSIIKIMVSTGRILKIRTYDLFNNSDEFRLGSWSFRLKVVDGNEIMAQYRLG